MDNKVVLITGGSSGLGFGVAVAFAKANYNVVITGRNIEKLNNAKNKLEAINPNIKVMASNTDGTKYEQIPILLEEVKKHFGRLDCLINNANATTQGKLLMELSFEEFQKAIDSNIYATFHYLKSSYELLKESKGSVINFVSHAGIAGYARQSSYSCAKEGIRGLSRTLAIEWGSDDITVNCIAPFALTESLDWWRKEFPDQWEKIIADVPMKRFGDPEKDIGSVCVFLASDQAKYLTGQTIQLQGGAYLKP